MKKQLKILESMLPELERIRAYRAQIKKEKEEKRKKQVADRKGTVTSI